MKSFLNNMHLLLECISSLGIWVFFIFNIAFIFNPNMGTGIVCAIVALIGAVSCCIERAIECYTANDMSAFITKHRLKIFIFALAMSALMLLL